MRTTILAGFGALCSPPGAPPTTPSARRSPTSGRAFGQPVLVEARITDETGVLSAICHHRTPGGRVEASPMVKSDLDDTLPVSFPGSPQSEYWIEAATSSATVPRRYGSAAKAFVVGGKAAPDSTSPELEASAAQGGATPREAKPQPEAKPEPDRWRRRRASAIPAQQGAYASARNRDTRFRTKIVSNSPWRSRAAVPPARHGTFTTRRSRRPTATLEAQIPASMARGTVEYSSREEPGRQMTRQEMATPRRRTR